MSDIKTDLDRINEDYRSTQEVLKAQKRTEKEYRKQARKLARAKRKVATSRAKEAARKTSRENGIDNPFVIVMNERTGQTARVSYASRPREIVPAYNIMPPVSQNRAPAGASPIVPAGSASRGCTGKGCGGCASCNRSPQKRAPAKAPAKKPAPKKTPAKKPQARGPDGKFTKVRR